MAGTDPYHVIGFSLLGPAPIKTVHIRWRPGIQVLYGLNGAGKTRILEALSDFGQPSREKARDNFLHLQLSHEIPIDWEADQPTLIEEIGIRLLTSFVRRASPTGPESDRWGPHDDIHEIDELNELIRFSAHNLPTYLPPEVADELHATRFVSITASGELWLSALPGQRGPGTRKLLEDIGAPLRSGPKMTTEVGFRREFESTTRLAELQWPYWAPQPIFRMFAGLDNPKLRQSQMPALINVISDQDGPAEEATSSAFADLVRHAGWIESVEDGTLFEANAAMRRLVERATEMASSFASGFLMDSPALRLELLDPADWLLGTIVRWSAHDRLTDQWLPITALSAAQAKWARFSIAIVNRILVGGDIDRGRMMMLIDEPEQGLHPAAVNHLLEELESHANQLRGPIMVASHSPQVLGWSSSVLLHVARDMEGGAVIEEMELSRRESLKEAADRLGMRTVDLLQLYRVFLVVEGIHDSTALEAIFPEQWDSNRIRLVHMLGSHNVLDLAGSELLRNFTDASIVVLLDDVSSDIADQASLALALAADGDRKGARKRLMSLRGRAGHAERLAIDLATGFLDQPLRLHLTGLEKADIIEYFDPSAFELTEDWGRIRTRYKALKHPRPPFKDWLRSSYQAQVNVQRVEEAASKLSDEPPAEFASLLELCIRLSHGERLLSTSSLTRRSK